MAGNWIYVIGSMERMDRVKIGIASDVISRMNGLQCGSPLILHLWASFKTHDRREHAMKAEAGIHKYFSEYRLHSEWFNVTPKVAIDVVEKLSKVHPLKISEFLKVAA